ncbi:30S ribosomal protein S4 [Candidatus Peregrinibacteria bacterium]|mgnify:CR=1 FL=1|jgi:small subunit ribosomal protein S4|nr:30S ribosomal protein S4 [Candidatus Peregrinibacteria bacterium]
MSTYRGAKAKLCRRIGINLFGSPKYDKILTKKGYPPGVHGRSKFSKKSEYGKQLEEKQKARFMFNTSEKQFKKYYEKADKMPGVTGEELLRLLERRADNVIFRAGFAITRFQSRQMVSHGLFNLNGRRIDVPSINIREGDVLEIRERSKKSKLFEDTLTANEKYKVPGWLEVDPKKMTITIKRLPEKDELEQSINSQLIVEFYSR